MVVEALVDRAFDAIRDKQALGVCTLGEEARGLCGERGRQGVGGGRGHSAKTYAFFPLTWSCNHNGLVPFVLSVWIPSHEWLLVSTWP